MESQWGKDFAAAVPAFAEIPSDEKERLSNLFSTRLLANGEVFRRPDQEKPETALIMAGIIRHYVIDRNGHDRTTDFCRAGEFTGVVDSGEEDDGQWLAAVGETRLAVADSAALMAFASERLIVQKAISSTVLAYLGMKAKRESELLSLDPADRYESFARNFPDILNEVPQYLVASYLGIAPETLSRVRARLRHGESGQRRRS